MNQRITNISLVVGLLISLGTLGSMLGFPEMWQSHQDEKTIQKEVHKIALEFPSEIQKKYSKDSLEFRKMIRSNWKLYKDLEKEVKKLNEKFELIDNHAKFNTTALTITSSALLEEMDKKQNGCGWDYYETNGGDNWAMFPDKYNSEILYSVDLRSDCRAYYTPINGAKTKVNF